MTFFTVTVGWILSLCLHEYAHARVAYSGGDTSVVDKGYLSFNPFRYADVAFTIVMPVFFLLLGGLGLPGAAVHIDHTRIRSAAWRSAISAAGPATNVVAALGLGMLLYFTNPQATPFWSGVAFLAVLQVSAAILSLIPVPPLDGFGIIAPFLPESVTRYLYRQGLTPLWVLFVVLFYVPIASQSFWSVVYGVSRTIGIDSELAWHGLQGFMFWRSVGAT